MEKDSRVSKYRCLHVYQFPNPIDKLQRRTTFWFYSQRRSKLVQSSTLPELKLEINVLDPKEKIYVTTFEHLIIQCQISFCKSIWFIVSSIKLFSIGIKIIFYLHSSLRRKYTCNVNQRSKDHVIKKSHLIVQKGLW